MGRPKINKAYRRTLGTIGGRKNHSFYVTLPISFIRSLNWTDGKRLVVKKVGSKIHITSA